MNELDKSRLLFLPVFAAGLAAAFLLHATIASAAEPVKSQDPPQFLANMPAGLYKTDNNHTHLYFTYSHVGFSRSHGRFDRFSGELQFDPKNPESSAVTFTIDPTSIDMNVSDLDAQLKGANFFDVASIHEIKFVGHGFLRRSGTEGSLIGDLTMHGVTHPVTLAVRLNKFLVSATPKFTRFGFTATGTIKRSEWGLGNVPLVGDDVALDFDVEFTKAVT